jgi:uncharacterized membrane protein YccC
MGKEVIWMFCISLVLGLAIVLFICLAGETNRNEFLESANKGLQNELMAMQGDLELLPPPVM